MKKIIMTLLLVLISEFCFSSTISTKRGPVDFPHQPHTSIMGCMTCHNPHGGMMGGFGAAERTHAFCQSCHNPNLLPDKCKFCHKPKK